MGEAEIQTIGHSTHELDRFVELLRGHDVRCVADVRATPRSRRMPHFDGEALAASLPALGIGYEHVPELGGRRPPAPGSPNGGWRKDGFRGYADHMASTEFAAGLERLEGLAREQPVAVTCAEALWWRCHRRLVSDALTVRGWRVCHVGADGRTAAHELTDFAVADGTALTYPPRQAELGV